LRNKVKFSYRECNLDDNLIFISATFRGKKDNKPNIQKKVNNLIKQKKRDQPSKIKTCGSTFKNPENNSKIESEVRKEVIALCAKFPIYNHLIKD